MEQSIPPKPAAQSKLKFYIGGALIFAAVIYLIVSSTSANTQYYLTIQELLERKMEMVNRDVRVSGAVLGETIQYNPDTLALEFTVVQIPADNTEIEKRGGLAQVLHDATLDSTLDRLHVVYQGVKPDLLKNEAQAIMTGSIGEDNVFYADELLLKCPSRYEDALPSQVVTP